MKPAAFLEQDILMWRNLLAGGVMAAALLGCGGDGKLAPVSGTVTLNGKPVAGIEVTFQPLADEGKASPGPAAFGITGPDGRYSAKVIGEETQGATVGKNLVRFSVYADPADFTEEGVRKTKPTVKIPAHYWSESKIEFEVPAAGTSTADFQLTSP